MAQAGLHPQPAFIPSKAQRHGDGKQQERQVPLHGGALPPPQGSPRTHSQAPTKTIAPQTPPAPRTMPSAAGKHRGLHTVSWRIWDSVLKHKGIT